MDELLDNRMLIQRLVVVLRGEIARCIDPRYTGPRCESSWIQDFEYCKELSEAMSFRGQVRERQGKMAERSKALESGYLPIQSERARVRISFLSNRFDFFHFLRRS